MLHEQLHSAAIKRVPFALEKLHKEGNVFYTFTQRRAVGVLLAETALLTDDGTASRVSSELWESPEARVENVAQAYISALNYLGRGGEAEKRQALLGQLTPTRVERLSPLDKVELLSTIAQTNTKDEKELQVSYDPKQHIDGLLLVLNTDEVLNRHDTLAHVLSSQEYYEKPEDFDEVLDKVIDFFVAPTGAGRRTVEDFAVNDITGKNDIASDTADEVDDEGAWILKMKVGTFFAQDTIEALIDKPEAYTKLTDALLQVGYKQAIGCVINDHADKGLPHVLALLEKSKQKRSETLEGQGLRKTVVGYIKQGDEKRAYELAKKQGVFEPYSKNKTGYTGYNDYKLWGETIAYFVQTSRERGNQQLANTMEQDILMNDRVNVQYTNSRSYDVINERLEQGDVAGAVRTAIDGQTALHTEFDDGVVQLATKQGHGKESINAIMNEELTIFQKQDAIKKILLTLEHLYLDSEIDPEYQKKVKRYALSSLKTLMEQYRIESPRGNAEMEFMANIALAGGENEALEYLNKTTVGFNDYYVGNRTAITNEIIVQKALKVDDDELQNGYKLFMDSPNRPTPGQKRVILSLLIGALLTGNESVLRGIYENDKDVFWQQRAIYAAQRIAKRSPELSTDGIGLLMRNSTVSFEDVASFLNLDFAKKLHEVTVS